MTVIKRITAVLIAITVCVGLTVSSFAAKYVDLYPNTHKNTGQNIADLIAVARTQLGYTELDSSGYPLTADRDGGYTKYGASFGDPYGPWCAYFVSWCASQAGIPTSVIPRLGSCNAMVRWFTRQSRYFPRTSGYAPHTGDIIFYDWSGGSTPDHVGIVTGVSGNQVYVIEGNADSSLGYRCIGKTRIMGVSYICGYGVPNYNDSATFVGSYAFSAPSSTRSGSVAYGSSRLSVITTTATNITSSNAVLNGGLKNSGKIYISSLGFYFGTDKKNLKKYPVLSSSKSESVNISIDVKEKIGEMKPKTTYYYCTYATFDGRDCKGPMYAVATLDDKPQKLMLSETNANVGIGQTTEIVAIPYPYGSVSKGVEWKSSDESVAKVDANGVVTGLKNGTATITATTKYCSVSSECKVKVLMPTPQDVTLTNLSKDEITLTWTPVENANGYIIYRSTDPQAEFKKIGSISGDAVSFTDNHIQTGKRYYYVVSSTAKNKEFNSDFSEMNYITARLSAPKDLYAARLNNGMIQLKWRAVEGAEKYIIYRTADEKGIFSIVGEVKGNRFTDCTALTEGKYYYKVVAANDYVRATSDFSNVSSSSVLSDIVLTEHEEFQIRDSEWQKRIDSKNDATIKRRYENLYNYDNGSKKSVL